MFNKKFEVDTLITGCLLFTSFLMCILVFLTSKGGNAQVEVSRTVTEFLNGYMEVSSDVDEETVVERYFSCVDKTSIDRDGRSQVLRDLDSVFMKGRSGAISYRICVSVENYVEILLTDSEGNELPPRIGLIYKIGSDNLISSFTVFRLQPVCNNDPEWRSIWQ